MSSAQAGLIFTRAGLSDAKEVRQISEAAYVPAYEAAIGDLPKPATEDYRPRIERGEIWLLENQEHRCGLVVLEDRPDHLLVYSIAVRPQHQNRGLGRRLLAFAAERARAQGLAELRLYTNSRMTANVRLYLACGFRIAGSRPHPSRSGETLLDFSKAVPSQKDTKD